MSLLQEEMAAVLSFAAALSRRTGLGVTEMAALEHLQRASHDNIEGLTPTQLGQRLSLSSGAVTALVDRMESGGLVERRPNPGDRRSSLVCLIPAGLEEAREHLRPLAAELLEVSGSLSDEQRAVIGGYLEEVTKVLARHSQAGRP